MSERSSGQRFSRLKRCTWPFHAPSTTQRAPPPRVPIVLKALGQDPATSSSIVLTTFTDCGGFLSFLGLATLLSSILNLE